MTNKLFLIFVSAKTIFLLSCSTPQYMQDELKSRYFEVTIYADAGASYLGEWTTSDTGGLLTIKINENGIVKMCSGNPYFGEANGKVFKEDGKIKMIFESGTIYEIKEVTKEYLLISSYGIEKKYYAGNVPERCKEMFLK